MSYDGPQNPFQGNPYQQNPYSSPQAWAPPIQPATTGREGLAVASMVLGIVSLVGMVVCTFVSGITAIIGLPLGLFGLKSAKRGMALAGVIMNGLALLVVAGLVVLLVVLSMTGNLR
jgi:hypothetical protein